MPERPDPLQHAADGEQDLQGIATWEPRSLLDRFLDRYTWPLLRMSVVALAIALAKLWEFTRTGVWRRRTAMQALAAWRAGRGREALERLEHVRDPLGDVLRTDYRCMTSDVSSCSQAPGAGVDVPGDVSASDPVAERGFTLPEGILLVR
jgi:hypothetical protein